MCGIVGIWQKDGQPVLAQLLIQMRETMYSRGPDDAGLWLDGAIGFGHRRLSIIDLSPLGHQPMIDEETGAVITYNGEVYNYRELRKELEGYGLKFKGQSDTEVILKAYRQWGQQCVEKFIGMFSFAIWNPKLKGLFIARDRMGIKPLYYYFDDKIFLFASRLRALMIHPLCPHDIDLEALGLYLDMGYVPAPWAILKGIKKLNPGHTLWVDSKGLAESCYWSLDNICIDDSLGRDSEEELIDRLDQLLKESVKLRLVSDVLLGALLSGGVDSSLIVALMHQYSQAPIKTFTIGFKEEKFDESDQAQEIAKYLGVESNVKIMTSNDLLSLLDDNALYYDEPLADSSNLPTMMVSRFARESVTVCLSGDGGDELFAGYHIYPILSFSKSLDFLPPLLRSMLGKAMAKVSSRKFSIIGDAFSQRDLLSSFVLMRGLIKDYNRKAILSEDTLNMYSLFSQRSSHFPVLDVVSSMCRLDAAYYLADDVLQKVDVASMSTSLEVRVPILDHRVVEFSQSLPIKFKLRGINGKWILKKVLSKYIPPKIYDRPKRGFVVPIDKWFRGELREMLQDELSPARIRRNGCLNQNGVAKLLDLHLSNKQDTHPMLWSLLSFFALE